MSTVKNSCQVPKSQMGPLVSYLAFGFVCSLAVEKVDEQPFFPSRNRWLKERDKGARLTHDPCNWVNLHEPGLMEPE